MEQSVAVMPRVLGSLFYYSPANDDIWTMMKSLDSLVDCFDWQDSARVERLLSGITLPTRDDAIWQFSVLFEGQGHMTAPPWGSVYLDKDNLLMGETTLAYRRFLAENGIVFESDMRQPEDQFGLMLLAMAQLLELDKEEAVQTLLAQHLLPWSYRYLEKLQENEESALYAALAQLAAQFLHELEALYSLTPIKATLRF